MLVLVPKPGWESARPEYQKAEAVFNAQKLWLQVSLVELHPFNYHLSFWSPYIEISPGDVVWAYTAEAEASTGLHNHIHFYAKDKIQIESRWFPAIGRESILAIRVERLAIAPGEAAFTRIRFLDFYPPSLATKYRITNVSMNDQQIPIVTGPVGLWNFPRLTMGKTRL